MTTEISFYHLTHTPLEQALPQLLTRVLESGKRALVVTNNTNILQHLDTILWTFSPDAFLPHSIAGQGNDHEQPILLSTTTENNNNAQIIVRIQTEIDPEIIIQFERCLDIFNGVDTTEVNAARERWKYYQTNPACTLTYWKQTTHGKWEKAQ